MTEVLPPYILKRNARSRTVRVSVSVGGKVKVSAPRWTTEATIKKFLLDHVAWLWQKVEHFKKFPERKRLSKAQEKKLYVSHKARAKAVAEAKVKQWNKQFQFIFSRISIRKSRTRWGSCSSKGTLCFNYKIVFCRNIWRIIWWCMSCAI
jgi:predicted metal-dependent hydrolase